jgi:Flp pilus assembly protein CpaB
MATDKKLALAAVVVSLVVLPLAWAQTAQRTATYAAGAVVVDTATLEVTPDGGCDARVCARLDGGAGLPPRADSRHVGVAR